MSTYYYCAVEKIETSFTALKRFQIKQKTEEKKRSETH